MKRYEVGDTVRVLDSDRKAVVVDYINPYPDCYRYRLDIDSDNWYEAFELTKD